MTEKTELLRYLERMEKEFVESMPEYRTEEVQKA